MVLALTFVISCSNGPRQDNVARLKEINVKSCMSGLIQNNLADSATAKDYCECKVNKMFEAYSVEEIIRWGELSREERDKREFEITKDCEGLLIKKDSLQ